MPLDLTYQLIRFISDLMLVRTRTPRRTPWPLPSVVRLQVQPADRATSAGGLTSPAFPPARSSRRFGQNWRDWSIGPVE